MTNLVGDHKSASGKFWVIVYSVYDHDGVNLLAAQVLEKDKGYWTPFYGSVNMTTKEFYKVLEQ